MDALEEQRAMSLKLQFVERAAQKGSNLSALCLEFGVSRQTGHKWLRRYRELGPLGLVEQSRRPDSSPGGTGEDVVLAILALRNQHPSWGPDKISRVSQRSFGPSVPSRSTVARTLRQLGKVKRRRSPVRIWTVNGRPRVEVSGPDDLWTMDFKGWWRAGNGQKCEPFTVRDAYSRFVLAATLLPGARGELVRRVLEQLFREHGTPLAIQCDNGSPFVCTRARGGLTQLSAWLVSLGIRLIRSRPAKPQDNGGHERMHRDLAELELAPARSRRAQQHDCDRWLVDFNNVRPNEALGGKTPAEVYKPSRRVPAVQLPNYPPEYKVRRVNRVGIIKLYGDCVYVSVSLRGQLVGLHHESGMHWRVYFHEVDLGVIEIVNINDALSLLSASESIAVNPHGDTSISTSVNT
jgi:transposase InsO family protein